MRRTTAGGRADFEGFVRAQQSALFAFAVVLCGDRVEAQDVLAETFGRAFQQWAKISRVANVTAYVRKMVLNEFLSGRRRSARTEPVADLADLAGGGAEFDQGHVERVAMIERISELPRQQQLVIALRFYYGLTDREIAAELDISPGTVRGYASRALASMRVQLQQERVPAAPGVLPGGSAQRPTASLRTLPAS